jgi:hypothetical protein
MSLGRIFLGDKSPDTLILVTIPVAPVVPIPALSRVNNEVLNPTVCLPSICLRESVDNPETVILSPTVKPCG